MAGRKRLIVTHSEIFPGTYASTTETADYLLTQLGLKRRAVLKWGPMGMQQLSEARAGKFRILGYAGNSAPDHVDQLHSLPVLLKWLRELGACLLHRWTECPLGVRTRDVQLGKLRVTH